jgi:hypothetical protein
MLTATIMQSFAKNMLQNKPALIVRLLLLCWIVTKLLCYPLWLGERFFPMVPVHSILSAVPLYWHQVLLWSALFFMLLCLVFPGRKLALFILIPELLSCLLDQGRWQPWEYQFLFMLAAYVFYSNQQYLFTAWQLMLAGLYFFSGLSKINPAFIHDVWNHLFLHNWLGIYTNHEMIFRLGYALPLVEMLAAGLLCFERFRKVGIILLAAMHLIILALFGPLGLNRNPVIWPWNLLMPVLLVLLFYRQSFLPQRNFFTKIFSWVMVGCFCILPWLHLADRWDHYLSFTMYSGGIGQLYLCTDDPAALQKMGKYMGSFRNGMIPCRYPVSVYHWGIREMNTAPYPQLRVYQSIGRQWKNRFPGVAVKFYIYTSGFSPRVEELIIP